MRRSDYNRLVEIHEQIKDLNEEAMQIVRSTPECEAAHSYWYGQICCALDDEHMFVGSSMNTLKNTIDALEEAVTVEDEDEEELED